jgi:4-diphosphocytidyl-2-C-methyl-D-erythritol kinase
VRELAPAKINISLLVGPARADGRHELASVMQSITLCDELTLTDAERDEVSCPGVEGPNLAEAAVAGFRELTGWDGPGVRIEILKRIPVAAGLGGGSADAAAALRLLVRASGLGGEPGELLELAARLGSDVPSQLRPGRCLVRGGGELVEELPAAAPFGILVLPSHAALSAAAVYAQADRLGSPRSAQALATLDPRELVGVNDLQLAALTLEPTIAVALEHARGAGADHAFVSGSGPTVLGLFENPDAAEGAAQALASKNVEALSALPITAPG